ncbi:MAG: AIR synthase related protein, partial [Nanoarchaeota archaeon]|nr:AIR synthase related protein [Nanoarchaeota archaeon]
MTVKEKQKIRIDTIEIAEKALFGSSSGQDSFDSSQSEESSVKLSALEIALRDIGIGNARAFSTQIYTINGAELNDTELLKAGELLHHDVTQDAFFNEKLATERIWDFAIRVDYKPGVTDNAARVLKKDLSLIGITESDVYTSAVHYVKGDFNQTNSGLRDELERLASNPQIHNIAIITKEEFEKNNGFDKTINPVILPDRPNMFYVNVGAMDEAELILTGKDGTLNTNIEQNPKQERGGTLSLALDYLLEIQKYSNSELNMQSARTKENKGRLTDTELEVLAQMWSEHCRHSLYNASIKESDKGIFDHYIRQPTLKILEKKPHLGVSIYKDNSGVFRFNDKWLISIKNETHNSPSALDPYGGAITGIVGVNRDLAGTGMGAEVIANFLFYFLGHPEDKQKYFKRFEKFDVNNEKFQKEFINPDRVIYGEDKETIKGLLEELLLNPKQIFDGVVKGVEEGGNQMGIPINMGTINYHKRYNGKPIVGVGSIGRMPIKIGELYSHEKHIDLDDRLYICGGRAGIDGIHGATFSSEGLTAKSPATA